MIRYHCDVEGCDSKADLETAGGYGVAVPIGWATISWMAERKSVNKMLEALKAGVKAAQGDIASRRAKGIQSRDPASVMLGAMEGIEPDVIPVACSALVCAKCLSERLPLARFGASSF